MMKEKAIQEGRKNKDATTFQKKQKLLLAPQTSLGHMVILEKFLLNSLLVLGTIS